MFLSLAPLLLALIVPTSIAIETHDLSQPWHVGNTNSPAAMLLQESLREHRDIRRVLVVDDGEIVMEYQRDTVDDSDTYNLWSATKGFMGLFLGKVMETDEYNLSPETTLGEIFTDESAWALITDEAELAFKKNITVYELMTMTSGLDMAVSYQDNPFQLDFDFNIPDSVGENLAESLKFPDWNATQKGTFGYIPATNIPSYIISATTGMTPMEFVSKEIFPSLGIDPDEMDWDTNSDGVQTSYSHLKLNARQMAKLAQLYLQRGASAPGKQLVSEEFIGESLSNHVYDHEQFDTWYGYYWFPFEYDGQTEGLTGTEPFWCAAGFAGQWACVSYETGRVAVVQRSNTILDMEEGWEMTYDVILYALSTETSFEPAPTISPAPTTTTPEPSSSSWVPSMITSWTVAMVVAFVSMARL